MFASNGSIPWSCDIGLLLVGHGSREQAGTSEFLETARRVSEMAAGRPIEPCFLEFAEPTIKAGFHALVERGVRRIVVVPVLLFAAGHAKRDIPAAVAAAAASETMDVLQSAHLGCHELILELSAERYREAIAGQPRADDNGTLLLMVGRGSRDASATTEMRQFVERRAQESTARRANACFVAMAEPTLTAALDEAATSGARRIVVQPHLLFGGVLVDRIRHTVDEYAGKYPQIQWIAAGHLGPSDRVAAAVLDRAGEALASRSVGRRDLE